MMTHSLYQLSDGLFTGATVTCGEAQLVANVPEGCSYLVGKYDALSQRVDIGTGAVVDYVPPQPTVNHQWDTTTKRWVYVKTEGDIATEVRLKRNALLASSDWATVRSAERGEAVPEDWKMYREALRGIPEQPDFPYNVTWPTPP